MPESVTRLLAAHRSGDDAALDELGELLYPELKSMARRRAGAGMGATTLVNETFARMLSGGTLKPSDRAQFFAITATVMRRVIVDEIRYITAAKRDGQEVTLAETVLGDSASEQAHFLLEVDEMLGILEDESADAAKVFECRYFAGLTTSETADAVGTSERTVERLWSQARSRLAELVEESR